ncbi:DUF4263 domain-containing protein [Mesorhizobium sp. M1339]|uniref:Shedu anti-phage system protein SduA domain-containing protein n=1 Tax=Mesorhizobium sp. M1339 TaxID=2957086 RepID=UPI0033381FEF
MLGEYERLIREAPSHEPSFQDFFSRHPQLLDPMARQVWAQPDFHGALQPDFVIRRFDDSYLVVEIQCPAKKLVTLAGQVAQAAAHAEMQALAYEDFLSTRITEARCHFPNFHRADCLVVVGLQDSLTSGQKQALDRANRRKQNSQIVAFDWLLERGRAIVRNVSEGPVEVIGKHRVV